MPFPRPAARPWGGFDAAFDLPLPIRFGGGGGIHQAAPPQLRRLVHKAHAAERAAAFAYRGHRCCFLLRELTPKVPRAYQRWHRNTTRPAADRPPTRREEGGAHECRDVPYLETYRRLIYQLEVDELKHRAWLQRRLMPVLGMRPNPFLEAVFAVIGVVIALTCLAIGPFLATYFAGRLERDNGNEYDRMAAEIRKHPQIGAAEQAHFQTTLRHMAKSERQHERDLLQIIRHHPWLPRMVPLFQWPLRIQRELKSPVSSTSCVVQGRIDRHRPALALS